MLSQRDSFPKAKAVVTNVEVYDESNNLIRVVANAKMDGFAEEVDLPDGSYAKNMDMVPVRIKGVEAVWTEGEGETVFIWDCRNELGEAVKQGVYRIDIKQADSFGRVKTVSRVINIKDIRAM